MENGELFIVSRRAFFKKSTFSLLGTMVFPAFLKGHPSSGKRQEKQKLIINNQIKMERPYILAESYWKEVKDTDFELALLPWGATEAHNYHLPYSTDNIQIEYIVAEAARIAWEKGAKVTVLPTIPYGINTGQSEIKLDINLYPSTQMIMLTNIIESLNHHGIRRFVIMNGHGGNDFRSIVRELGRKFPEMFICVSNVYGWDGLQGLFEHDGDHANEMETSLMMYLTPEKVRPLAEAGDGKERKFKIEALRKGWFWAERRWHQVTDDTGIGNPKLATREKGEKYFKGLTEALAKVLIELAKSDIHCMYESD